ncbi:MAG TPA: hypothetical protein VHF51_12945 [Solirubrobacteraceae bacterium]|nr:hypothetical protein [Solirubrobacteraceae bacterium]
MPTRDGGSDGDLRQVPDTFTLADWPVNCWYAAAYDVELKRELLPRRAVGAPAHRQDDRRGGR